MLLDRECKQERHIITETPEIYQKYTKPLFIDKVNPSDCQWVDNILDKSKEVELTVFRNDLFTLQLDFEYNKGDITTLYLLALPIQTDLKTIRDLNGTHLPLLRSIRDNSYATIQSRFGLPRTQIKCLFHYYPTFYHLHIHFVHVTMNEQVGGYCCKGVLLDDVIEHLEMDPEYFAKKTLMVQVGDMHPIFRMLKELGVLKGTDTDEKE